MLVITDANSLFSFFKKDSGVAELVINSDIKYGLNLVAPKKLFVELDKHKQIICKLAEISDTEYEFLRGVLHRFVKTESYTFWQDFMPEADKLLGQHVKDVPYISLALAFRYKGEEVSIWSNEKRFKKSESEFKVFKTKELFKYLKSLGKI
tara:strand:+ start:386 stop:838 length:453 start_codon:yes stop_codon:yes gene_type:complete